MKTYPCNKFSVNFFSRQRGWYNSEVTGVALLYGMCTDSSAAIDKVTDSRNTELVACNYDGPRCILHHMWDTGYSDTLMLFIHFNALPLNSY